MIRGSDWPSIIVRMTFLLVATIAAIYLYRRYEVVHLAPDDSSMEIIQRKPGEREIVTGFPRGGLVLLDLWGAPERNSVVAYATAPGGMEDEEIRAGRVWGVPGDSLSQSREGVLIHGERMKVGNAPVHNIPELLMGQGGLLEEQYFVLNDNPDSMSPDGRNFGALQRERIRGVVVRNWPW